MMMDDDDAAAASRGRTDALPASEGGGDFFTDLGTMQTSRKEKEDAQAKVVVEEVSPAESSFPPRSDCD